MKKKNLIIPAILPLSREDFQRGLSLVKDFARVVQIDVADGDFVASKTLDLKDIKAILGEIKNSIFGLKFEIHLMVDSPISLVSFCQKLKPIRVFFHFEAKKINYSFDFSKKLPFEVGLAINPSTSIESFSALIPLFNSFLFMTVDPGFQGQPFKEQVLEKIKKFKRLFPEKIIEADGGINENNISKLAKARVDQFAVGSYLLKATNPKERYVKLVSILSRK